MNIFENMSKKKKYSILFLFFVLAFILFVLIEICLYKILNMLLLIPTLLCYFVKNIFYSRLFL